MHEFDVRVGIYLFVKCMYSINCFSLDFYVLRALLCFGISEYKRCQTQNMTQSFLNYYIKRTIFKITKLIQLH